MEWQKDAPARGLEFHLPGERTDASAHDEEWRRHRAERLAQRHQVR